jgi:hypothetical protein
MGLPVDESPTIDLGNRRRYSTLKTFITSTPRWLLTVTASRLFFGIGNGRDMSLLTGRIEVPEPAGDSYGELTIG